jgi:CubicO group peptidase (beta-lactamase class C family)
LPDPTAPDPCRDVATAPLHAPGHHRNNLSLITTRRRLLRALLAAPLVVSPTHRAAAAPPRQWRVTGEPVDKLDGLDAAMQRFMQSQGIRAGALAVARGGKAVFEHGYSWAQPDYPVVRPDSPFRLASVAKAFTAALTYRLAETHALTLDTEVFRFLGLDRPSPDTGRRDPRLDLVTVRHLVDHRGGWDQQISRFDPVFRMRDVARRLGLHVGPGKNDIARFLAGEPLQFVPGTRSRYSNVGYLMLGLVVEKATKTDYMAALRASVTGPLGIDAVFLARTRKDRRLDGEGFYDQPGTGLTPEYPDRAVLAPLPYGGGGFLTESMDSVAGLAASAGAVARLIGHYAVSGFGPRRNGQTSARSGIMSGTTSFAISRADGLDFCLIVNTRSLAIDATTLEITRVLDEARIR